MKPLSDEDIVIERITGKKKAGGANRNCVNSAVRITHKQTGIQVRVDGRDQHRNLQMALKELGKRLLYAENKLKAEARKERRDKAIKESETVRTYNFSRGTVKDHRTNKEASLKDVLYKGRIDLVAPRDKNPRLDQ